MTSLLIAFKLCAVFIMLVFALGAFHMFADAKQDEPQNTSQRRFNRVFSAVVFFVLVWASVALVRWRM